MHVRIGVPRVLGFELGSLWQQITKSFEKHDTGVGCGYVGRESTFGDLQRGNLHGPQSRFPQFKQAEFGERYLEFRSLTFAREIYQ